jgi:hypothetical protein
MDELKAKLIAHERGILDALCRRDVPALRGLVAPGIVFVNCMPGHVGGDDFFRALEAVWMKTYVMGEPVVLEVADDAWILTYDLQESGVADGEPYQDRTYSTSVVVRSAGRFEVVFHHATRHT